MTNLVLVDMDDLKVMTSEAAIPNEVWSTQEAADYLTISNGTLIKEAEANRIPGVKIARNWKFSSIALYEYVARKERTS